MMSIIQYSSLRAFSFLPVDLMETNFFCDAIKAQIKLKSLILLGFVRRIFSNYLYSQKLLSSILAYVILHLIKINLIKTSKFEKW